MAMITQRGVDRFTAATRGRFDAENEQFDRSQALKRAARRASLSFEVDPEKRMAAMREDAVANAVRTERTRQQVMEVNREGQGVRDRFSDPAGTEFQSSQRLFDAGDVSILPEAVLARHGRMAPSELVRTERDRVNGGGRAGWDYDAREGVEKSRGWDFEDDFNAGQALGSRKMMDAAVEGAAAQRAPELVDANKLAEADAANGMRRDRAKKVRDFDVATARGQVPAAMVRTGDYAFGSGGTINRGGMNFDVPMGIGQGRSATMRPVSPGERGFETVEPVPVTVVDQRFTGSGAPSRTGARAMTAPSFDAGEDVPTARKDTRLPRRGWDY